MAVLRIKFSDFLMATLLWLEKKLLQLQNCYSNQNWLRRSTLFIGSRSIIIAKETVLEYWIEGNPESVV